MSPVKFFSTDVSVNLYGQVLHYFSASRFINRDARLSIADIKSRASIGWGVQLIYKAMGTQICNFNEGCFRAGAMMVNLITK